MRDTAFAVIRAVGVETGGSNIQFAVDPETGRQVVIEMNPRVSRSSALASKATGFPIAKIAAKLALGYTLDEIPNDITRETPASFEPSLDYVVVKIPRFAFEKFPGADHHADDAHEERRRGDGPRAQLHRGAAEGGPVAGGQGSRARLRHAAARQGRVSRAGGPPARPPAAVGPAGVARRCHGRGDARGDEHRPLVPRPDAAARRGRGRPRSGAVARRRRAAPGEAARVLRPPDRRGPQHLRSRRPRRGRRAPAAPCARRATGLQDSGHVCGRVRRAHAVPLLLLRRGGRGRDRRPGRRC